jgi:hypothetical protein
MEPGINRAVTWLAVIAGLILAVAVILRVAVDAFAADGRPSYAEVVQQRDKAQRQRTRYRLGYLKLRRTIRDHARAGYALVGLRCIQNYEGSWRDHGAPYWGGLQMDRQFMRTYGGPLYDRHGTADHWPVEAQLAVGVIAVHSGRGFGPWPNTRKQCGL